MVFVSFLVQSSPVPTKEQFVEFFTYKKKEAASTKFTGTRSFTDQSPRTLRRGEIFLDKNRANEPFFSLKIVANLTD